MNLRCLEGWSSLQTDGDAGDAFTCCLRSGLMLMLSLTAQQLNSCQWLSDRIQQVYRMQPEASKSRAGVRMCSPHDEWIEATLFRL